MIVKNPDLGTSGEEIACRFLRNKGYTILQRNYRARSGEIDIVARIDSTIIFVEVKTRASGGFAQPWEAVGHRKRRKLVTVAKLYVEEHSIRDMDFRFDVISILWSSAGQPEIEWIQSAF